MVMTPDFHPGDQGLIPLVGDKIFFNFYTYFLVPNSVTAEYDFQHIVQ